jgi:MFS family permease
MDDELVLFELREIKAGVEIDRISGSGGWLTFFKNPSMRRRLAIIVLIGTANQCSGNGIVNYYLVPILKQVGISKPAQTSGINGGLSVWSWFCAMGGAFLVDRIGRRKLFLISFAGMFVRFVSGC